MGNLNTFQTLTIELTGNNSLKALKDLEHKHYDFRRWVDYAENSPTLTSTEAKLRWAEQKKKLQKLIR